jgi:tRNA/tmRNA/rRNA uracil-C5-methylase (TrmA/RlmC/RlmD family)
VARLDDGRVVFVRHALPGERVEVEVTEGTDGDKFWRADAVTVLSASADRVEAPCPVAGPGLCGGCDFQHVTPARQRQLKADVVAEQLRRLAGLVWDVTVEAVPGDADGLRWRTRTRFAHLPDGRPAMRMHGSHELVPVDECLIALPASDAGPEVVEAAGRQHTFRVAADGFWQVHPGAPRVLVETVLAMLRPEPGERVLDLYAGVGLFAAFLADAVGPEHVVAVEGHPGATRDAAANLPRGVRVLQGDVARVLAATLDEPFDLVVLDPPREGARRKVVEQVVDRAPRAVAYVACDPAALARDVATFASLGYSLRELRAFDLFPMTHHVECVALLVQGSDQSVA